MAPQLFSPPSPSPRNRRGPAESLYSTPTRQPSPNPSSVSTIRAAYAQRNHVTPINNRTGRDEASDFHALHASAREHTIAFRIHSPASAPGSTLIWSGNPSTSGFFPYNAHLAVSPSTYLQTLAKVPLESPNWDHGPYVRHTMVDHINGKMRQGLVNLPSRLEERPGTPQDDKSPWISGTRSLVWAIWEIARRLAWGEPIVGMAVIKIGAPGWDDGGVITAKEEEEEGYMSELERWRKADERKRKGFIGKEVIVNPLKPISAAIGTARGGVMSVSMKEAYEMALRSARESEEVLWYARVFAESIERNPEFTVEHLPLELPVQFWKPRLSRSSRRRYGRNTSSAYTDTATTPKGTNSWSRDRNQDETSEGGRKLDGWLSRLVWDPRTDEYERAVQKIVERRRQIFMSRGVSREACPLTPV